MSLDDLTLVVRAQEGDVRAFEALARRHQAALYRLRVCWVLRELEGLGYGEIAEITGAGETAVRGRIHRARVQLAGVMRAWR